MGWTNMRPSPPRWALFGVFLALVALMVLACLLAGATSGSVVAP